MCATDANGSTIGKTKIVATIGPASATPDVLRALIEAGVSVFRLNFSHGTHDGHSAVVSDIRSVSRALGRHVAILQDLCGPKMRLGTLPGDVIECQLGEEYTLVSEPSPDGVRELTCSYRQLPDDLKPGETVLFADGTVAMAVTETAPGRARLKVTLPGRLRSRQGVNLPGSDLAVDSLTSKDLGISTGRRGMRLTWISSGCRSCAGRRMSNDCVTSCRPGTVARGSSSRSRNRRRCGIWRRSSPPPTR